MNTQQYIQSGILEAYLLGLASEEEQYDVQRMATAYPEINTSLNFLEEEIENLCLQEAVPPPPNTWQLIQARINKTEIKKYKPYRESYQNGSASAAEKPDYLEVEVNNTHIQVHKLWRTAFIAVFILGKIFLATALYYYFKSNSQEQEIERLKAEVHQTR